MKIKVFDKAKYHFGGKWPAGLPIEQAYVHTGLFLAWLINRALISVDFATRQRDAIESIRSRTLTGPSLFHAIDGVLDSAMLSAEGRAFCEEYYDLKSGPYIDEYESLLARDLPSLYHVTDTWAAYDRLAQHLDRRFAEWRGRRM